MITFSFWNAMNALAEEIRANGVMSKSMAKTTNQTSTADIVKDQLFNHPDKIWAKNQLATDVVQWMLNKSVSPVNSFMTRAKQVVETGNMGGSAEGTIRPTDMVWLAPLFSAYSKEQDKAERDSKLVSEYSQSEYMGELKVRAEFFLKVLESVSVPNRGFLVNRVVDRNGNVGVIFSNEKIAEEKECILIKATPVRHEVSNFTKLKETTFNRIKILRNVGAATT
tara:strand:+ start:715 stop:1386 length:672 start_codon:yes stop_codon:yes gene_type:complete